MGHVFNFQEALASEQWFQKPQNRSVFELEAQLMRDLLKPMRGESVLDVGCGIGACLQAFLDMGLQVTGLDPSTYMLDVAIKNLGNRVDLYRGYAEDLPFDDNSFTYACLFTTLEFVEDPQKALEEAFRVAKDRVFIGVLNRYAIKGIQRRVKGMFSPTIYNHAQFFSVWELKGIIRGILGSVPISWRTVCQLPSPGGQFVHSFEQNRIIQRCPFGAFAGMVISLIPRFRTRPLAMRYQTKHTTGTATG
ncbi:MAG: class I SAM-dependent methyltransferase [Desulfobacterales bacterium]|nr:MAG: class I SAM-dependent methyltransferase [Desulfobacterales bacterium]